MRVQIDTKLKTIKVLEDFNFSELVKALKKLLGDDYGDYKFIASDYVYTYWTNPITINPWIGNPYPWSNPFHVTYTAADTSVYNVELQGIEENTKN